MSHLFPAGQRGLVLKPRLQTPLPAPLLCGAGGPPPGQGLEQQERWRDTPHTAGGLAGPCRCSTQHSTGPQTCTHAPLQACGLALNMVDGGAPRAPPLLLAGS